MGCACEMVWASGGRESIFLISHTNEFCGSRKVACEPVLACSGLKDSRRAYKRAGRGPRAVCRVGKFRIVVKRRGDSVDSWTVRKFPGYSSRGPPASSKYSIRV